MTPHPKGTRARVLLSSVFGPYAQDDGFGSRAINPMELYHNQVTRVQGEFSLRMFHRSWGIQMIQENISAPCTVLDFPTRQRFADELRRHRYDVVGISAIVANVGKVEEMCRMARALAPQATLVVGGHVSAIPGLEARLDADHLVRGDGIAWMRAFLGEPVDAPIRHPPIVSAFGVRALGLRTLQRRGETAATIITSVGCPMGCNFCATSAFFGGRGRLTHFLKDADEIFAVMGDAERRLGVHSFFMMDENFLLFRPRALRLLELMERHGKGWSLYVFSSAHALAKYSTDELVRLGISWVWIGVESPRASYAKLKGADTQALVARLRDNGIRVLASSIIGLEHHTLDNIDEDIAHAVGHAADFHQFMLYTPVPGTPLHHEMAEAGRLLPVDLADIHGQFRLSFRHPAITPEQSEALLTRAFVRDFEQNGPSLFRICETSYRGWLRHRNHADGRVRARMARERRGLGAHAVLLRAMERRLNGHGATADVTRRIARLRADIERTMGVGTRLTARLAGPLLAWTSAREARRLAAGVTYEPRTFVER
ncbi:MAG: radical SAM protein, partial [Acidobacteriota bacterium]